MTKRAPPARLPSDPSQPITSLIYPTTTERTRNTIESLERRIRELEGQQPFQELQRVVQERDRAIAECEEYRRRLGLIASIAGGAQPPSLNGMLLHHLFE